MFYLILKHSHSILRWFFLLALIITLIRAGFGYFRNQKYLALHKTTTLSTLIISHLQFVLGFVLFLVSPKVVFSGISFTQPLLRFFLLEHTSMMLAAIVFITIGHTRVKLVTAARQKHRTTLVYFGLALLIVLLAIPWPWRALAAGWF